MTRTGLAIFGLCAIAMAGTALANEPGMPRGEKIFGRIDADHNGKISREELMPQTARRFLKVDANADGTVTTSEIDGWLKPLMERRKTRILSRMDADKNGDVSRQELDLFIEALFKEADSDQDGGVSLTEARAFRMSRMDKLMRNADGN